MKLSMDDRVNRIINSDKIVYLEDMTVHSVNSVETVGKDLLFVNTGSGLLFQDTDVMTLEEACDAERFVNKIKNNVKYNIWHK
jgi:hypothetical protein